MNKTAFPCLAGLVQPCRWPDCECQIKAGANAAPQSPKTSDGTERNESPAVAALPTKPKVLKAVVCNLAAWFNMPDEPYRPYYGRKKKQ